MASLESAIRRMLAESGTSQVAASTRMGRSRHYVANVLAALTAASGKTTSVDTLAELADACDYDLALVPRDGSGEVVRIDP